MNIFPWKKKQFFTEEEREAIVSAIREVEKRTSGELRVFVESRCKFMDPIDRAGELFFLLEMQKTRRRNGVILYVALKDRQLAVFGDEGIHRQVGTAFWQEEVAHLLSSFNRENYADGIRQVVLEIGEALHTHFPYEPNTDKNELPDDIVFGR